MKLYSISIFLVQWLVVSDGTILYFIHIGMLGSGYLF